MMKFIKSSLFINTVKCLGLLLVILLMTGCDNQARVFSTAEKSVSDSLSVVHLGDTFNFNELCVQIEPGSDSAVSFYLSPTDYDFGDYQKLVASLVQPGMTDKEKSLKLWTFVCNWV